MTIISSIFITVITVLTVPRPGNNIVVTIYQEGKEDLKDLYSHAMCMDNHRSHPTELGVLCEHWPSRTSVRISLYCDLVVDLAIEISKLFESE